MNVLIVDDKEENLYLLETLLKSIGYEVASALNGVEALEKLHTECFDLIVSDVLMPVMDGFQLCRNVKKDTKLKDIPIIFHTASYTDEKDEHFALKLGVEKYIRKPCEPAEFIKIIQGVMRDAMEGKIKREKPVLKDEKEIFKMYSERLVNKLEKKMLDLKESERKLRIVSRALKSLSRCNQALIRAKEESNLLNEICKIIVDTGGYRLAWIGFTEQDNEKSIRPAAQVGYEAGYLDTVKITWSDTEHGRGPTGTAIRTAKTIINRNILTNPDYLLLRPEALKRGYASSIALPLIADEQVLGALNIYVAEPDAFNAEEVELLTEMADDMAFGIMALRTKAERKQMEKMLLQSEKMASIGILAAGIAHEINNPIGYIHSNLKTLEKYGKKFINIYDLIWNLIDEHSKTMPDEHKDLNDKLSQIKEKFKIDYLLTDMNDAIEESIEGTEKVKKIVLDLRDFSRVEKPEMKFANINEGIEKTLNIVWNELKYKAEVIKEFGDVPEIECDVPKLSHVFMNILINAAQAIEKWGVIKIKTFSVENAIIIQISDTGKGIPKEDVGKIFDAFYTTKEPGKGTGLGLSISYKIIQDHRGSIDVESKVGTGTTFTIKLPINKDKPMEEQKKILIADDDKIIRDLLKHMIVKYDPSISIEMAKDGFEAADLLHAFNPNIVLLDINMPGMDGIEVCKKIMTDENKKNVKIVIITGEIDNNLKKRSLEAGAIEFMQKPIKFEQLKKVLDTILRD